MFSKLKEVKDLRESAKKMKNVLSDVSATGSALGGKVSVTMDGNQDVSSVTIDASLLTPASQTRVQDGVRDAVNSAVKEIQKSMAKKLRSGELEMPDMSNFKS